MIRNDGNTVLNADLTAALLDKNDEQRSDWTVEISPSEISDLAVGEVSIGLLMPSEDVERGSARLLLNLSAGRPGRID